MLGQIKGNTPHYLGLTHTHTHRELEGAEFHQTSRKRADEDQVSNSSSGHHCPPAQAGWSQLCFLHRVFHDGNASLALTAAIVWTGSPPVFTLMALTIVRASLVQRTNNAGLERLKGGSVHLNAPGGWWVLTFGGCLCASYPALFFFFHILWKQKSLSMSQAASALNRCSTGDSWSGD